MPSEAVIQISAVLIAFYTCTKSGSDIYQIQGSDGWGLGSQYEQMYNNYSLQSYYAPFQDRHSDTIKR